MNRVVLSSGTRQLLNKPAQTLARPVLVTQTRTYISLLPNWEDNTPVAPHQWGTKFVVSTKLNGGVDPKVDGLGTKWMVISYEGVKAG